MLWELEKVFAMRRKSQYNGVNTTPPTPIRGK